MSQARALREAYGDWIVATQIRLIASRINVRNESMRRFDVIRYLIIAPFLRTDSTILTNIRVANTMPKPLNTSTRSDTMRNRINLETLMFF